MSRPAEAPSRFKTWAPGTPGGSGPTVSLAEAARVLGLAPDVLRREWRRERLPLWKGSSHHHRVTVADLERFETQRWERGPAAIPPARRRQRGA